MRPSSIQMAPSYIMTYVTISTCTALLLSCSQEGNCMRSFIMHFSTPLLLLNKSFKPSILEPQPAFLKYSSTSYKPGSLMQLSFSVTLLKECPQKSPERDIFKIKYVGFLRNLTWSLLIRPWHKFENILLILLRVNSECSVNLLYLFILIT